MLETLGRKSGFIQRSSKLSACQFLNMLMFTHHQGKELTLLDLTGDLYQQFGVSLTKQSLQERFNERAVQFMQSVLSGLLHQQLSPTPGPEHFAHFTRVRIKDSTRFALPEQYAATYQGYGGATARSKSMITLQYEYDLLSGNSMDLRLTNGLCNDQSDARDHTHDILENDLFIRDLGYCTMGYLEKIVHNKAYFLNRLPAQTTVYQTNNPTKAIDFKACLKKMKKHQLSYLEYDVLVGKKAQIPSRLILSAVDDATYEKRLRKTQKQAKSYGNGVSDGFKARARLNLFITNAPQLWIPAEKVRSVYGLRWQIELIFKIWKSQAKINAIKQMNIHRFECQLIGKIIWLLINWRVYRWLTQQINQRYPARTCSVWKYYKAAFRISHQLRQVIMHPKKVIHLLDTLINMAKTQFLLECKKGKQSHYQALNCLA